MEGIKFRDLTHLAAQLGGSDTYVNVWDCRARLIVNGHDEDELNLSDEQRNAIEELKRYVVYTVNQGAINFSGHYHFDDVSLEVLRMILEGDIKDALDVIRKPTDKDFKQKATNLIELMEEGDYCTIYSSALTYGCWDGCQGYHNEQYVTLINGKYMLLDNGNAHHALSNSPRCVVREVSKSEAIEMLADYLRAVACRENYTVAELENYTYDSEYTSRITICEKHNTYYFPEVENCPMCEQ